MFMYGQATESRWLQNSFTDATSRDSALALPAPRSAATVIAIKIVDVYIVVPRMQIETGDASGLRATWTLAVWSPAVRVSSHVRTSHHMNSFHASWLHTATACCPAPRFAALIIAFKIVDVVLIIVTAADVQPSETDRLVP